MLSAATEYELRNLTGIIYLIINKINYKRYIGQSINSFHGRYTNCKKWYNSSSINRHLSYAIEKYGSENFEIRIICYNQSENALNCWEDFYIEYFQTCNQKYGYNIRSGGGSQRIGEESKLKLSISHARTKDEFIEIARGIHGDKYDYTDLEIIPFNDKVKIKCNRCSLEFWQIKSNHLNGCGCPECRWDDISAIKSCSFEDFVNRSNIIHNNEFLYEKENYKNLRSRVKIIHKKCQTIFYAIGQNHVRRDKICCPKCKNQKTSERRQYPLDNFLKKAHEKHGEEYTYVLDNYQGLGNHKKGAEIEIFHCICNTKFLQTPRNHLRSNRPCPKCHANDISIRNTKHNKSINYSVITNTK